MARFPYMAMVAILASLVSCQVVQRNVFAYAGFMMRYLGVVDDLDKAALKFVTLVLGVVSTLCLMLTNPSCRSPETRQSGRILRRFAVIRVHGRPLVLLAHLGGGSRPLRLPLRNARGPLDLGGALASLRVFDIIRMGICFQVNLILSLLPDAGFLTGLLNGTLVASKALVSEWCGKEHETVGMGVVTTSLTLGVVLGPGVGGFLAEPADHHPLTFSEGGKFGRYPYLLPNLVGAGLSFLALPLVFIYLKHDGSSDRRYEGGLEYSEKPVPVDGDNVKGTSPPPGRLEQGQAPSSTTLVKRGKAWLGSLFDYRRGYDRHNDADDDDEDGNDCEEDRVPEPATSGAAAPRTEEGATEWRMRLEQTRTRPPPTLAKRNGPSEAPRRFENGTGDAKPASLLEQQDVRTLLFIFGIYAGVYTALDEVFSLWTLSSVGKGVLDWSTVQIGQVFLDCGLMVLVFELFAVPNLTPRLGVKTSQRVGSVFEIPVYFLLPVVSRISGYETSATVAALLLLFTYNVCTNSFVVGIALAINSAAGPARRGEKNGMSVTVARTLSPVLCSALFAFSVDGDRVFPFDYHLVFYTLAAVRLTVAVMGWNRIGGAEKSTDRRPLILAQ